MHLPNMHAASKGSGSNKAVWSSILSGLHRFSFRKVMKVSYTYFDCSDANSVTLSARIRIGKKHLRKKKDCDRTCSEDCKIFTRVILFREFNTFALSNFPFVLLQCIQPCLIDPRFRIIRVSPVDFLIDSLLLP